MMCSRTCCVRRTGRTSEEHARPRRGFGYPAERRAVARAWQRCERLVVGSTAPDPTAVHEEATSPHRHEPTSNAFTYFERLLMIRDALLAEGLKPQGFAIVPFPVHEPG